MKTISLKLPDELDARISAIARRRRSNRSEVVRNALDAYLAKDTMPQKGSALDLAGDCDRCLAQGHQGLMDERRRS